MKYNITPTPELKRGSMIYISNEKFNHPYLVISSDEINTGKSKTIIVCKLTSRHTHLDFLGRKPVSDKDVVCANDILTIPKFMINRVARQWNAEEMKIVDEALKETLGMENKT